MHVVISQVAIKKNSKRAYNFEANSRKKWNNIHWVNPNKLRKSRMRRIKQVQ